MADFSKLAAVAPEWTEYAKTWSPPVPPAGATPQQVREGANRNTATLFDKVLGRPEEGLVVTEHAVPVPSSTTEDANMTAISVRLYKPTAEDATGAAPLPLPLYIFFHGGGYFLGNLDTEDANCRHLALQTGVAVLSVDYRKTPEHPFPAAADDAWAAFQWSAQTAGALGIDAQRIVVGGVSAGATLAISVALRAKEDSSPLLPPPVKGLVLSVPATVHPDHFPAELIRGGAASSSLVQNADAPFINAARLRGLMAMYRPAPPTHATVSPLLVPVSALAGLGPVAVHVAGRDPLRDEGLLFEQKLKEAG